MNNFFNHFSDGRKQVREKFSLDFFIDLRPENSHFKVGDVYNHFLDGKYQTFAKIVNINFKYLDVLPEHISFLCYGTNSDDAREYIKRRFNSTSGYKKINFKDKRLAVLTFQKCDPPKVEQQNLTL